MGWKKTTRNIIVWTLGPVGSVILISALFFLFIQTTAGKRFLASTIEAAISEKVNGSAHIDGIEGFVPFDISAKQLSLEDSNGTWLLINEASLVWSPLALIRGRIIVDNLRASSLHIYRLPAEKHPGSRKKPFALPEGFPSLTIRQFSIPACHIAGSVFGQDATFSIRAQIQAPQYNQRTEGLLEIRRVDGPSASFTADYFIDQTDKIPAFGLKAYLEEGKHGLIATALNRDDELPATITLSADGLRTDWRGTLKAQIPATASVNIAIGTTRDCPRELSADGTVTIEPELLPYSFRRMVGETLPVRLSLRYDPQGIVRIHSAHLATPFADLLAQGSLDLRKRTIESVLDLSISDLSAFECLFDTPCSGTASVHADVSGTITQPETIITVSAEQTAIGEVRAKGLDGTFSLLFQEGLQGLLVSASGNAVDIYGGDLPKPASSFSWGLKGTISSEGIVTVDRFSLSEERLSCVFSGTISLPAKHLRGTIHLVIPKISRVAAPLTKALNGSADFQAFLEGTPSMLEARFKGTVSNPQVSSPFIDPLLGQNVAFSGKVTFSNGKSLTLEEAQLGSGHATLSGSESFSLESGETEGNWVLIIPDINVLSGPFNQPLSGAATITASIRGMLDNPGLTISVEGKDLTVADYRFPRWLFSVVMADLVHNPHGQISTTLYHKDTIVSGSTVYFFKNAQLFLADLVISIPSNTLMGNVAIDLSSRRAEGTLQASLDDVSVVGSLFDETISGSTQTTIFLTSGATGQDVTLSLVGNAIISRFGSAGNIQAEAVIRDLFQSPEETWHIAINTGNIGKLAIDSLVISADSSDSGWNFETAMDGAITEPIACNASGNLRFFPQQNDLTMTSLEIQYGKDRVALKEPGEISWSTEGYTIQDWVFRTFPDGELSVTATYGDGKVSGGAQCHNLPLHLFRLGLPDGIQGMLSGNIKIHGASDRPEVTCAVEVQKLVFSHKTPHQLPEVSLSAQAQIKDGRCTSSYLLSGISGRLATGTLSVPLCFSFIPFTIAVDNQEPILGQITGSLNLEVLQAFIPGENHTLTGLLKTDITLKGTVDNPGLNGTIVLDHGSYENVWSGTILKEIEITVSLEDERIVITKALAIDNKGGTLSLSGSARLEKEAGFPLQGSLAMKKLALVQRDYFSAEVSGDIECVKALFSPTATGKLTVHSVKVHIPDRLPPDVAELPVTEINLPSDLLPPQAQEKTPSASAIGIDLALNIPSHLFLRGRGLDSEWKGSLHITGTTQEPAITGTMTASRGTYLLFDKRLTITNGVLIFDGSIPPAPTIYVQGEKRQADLTSRISVSGPLSAPKVLLESEPPYPPDEILSRLLFGRSVNRITPLQALQLAEALETLSDTDLNALDFMEDTRRLLRVDRLTLEESEGEDGGTAVSVGKYLREGVYVEMDKGVSEETDRISVEIGLTPNISIESTTGTNDEGGVGLNWKVDY